MNADMSGDVNLNNFHSWMQRIAQLEAQVLALQAEVAKMASTATPRKIEYHIGRLYVRELSGTLTIGVAHGLDDDTTLTQVADTWPGQAVRDEAEFDAAFELPDVQWLSASEEDDPSSP